MKHMKDYDYKLQYIYLQNSTKKATSPERCRQYLVENFLELYDFTHINKREFKVIIRAEDQQLREPRQQG